MKMGLGVSVGLVVIKLDMVGVVAGVEVGDSVDGLGVDDDAGVDELVGVQLEVGAGAGSG